MMRISILLFRDMMMMMMKFVLWETMLTVHMKLRMATVLFPNHPHPLSFPYFFLVFETTGGDCREP